MRKVQIGTNLGLSWAKLGSELCAGNSWVVHVLTLALLMLYVCTFISACLRTTNGVHVYLCGLCMLFRESCIVRLRALEERNLPIWKGSRELSGAAPAKECLINSVSITMNCTISTVVFRVSACTDAL